MRILGWHIDGFGHFQGHTQRDLGAGLTVLYGPNEAGKSTLLEFFLYVLFGPGRPRPTPLAGGRLGGRLFLEDGGQRLELERLDAPPVLRGGGAVLTGDDAVRDRLGGTDRALFRAVFAFSLADLTGLDGLGDDQLRDRLWSGAIAGAGRSVRNARRDLDARQERLWRPRSGCIIKDLQAELRALDERLGRARDQARRVRELRDEVGRLEDEAAGRRRGADAARRATQRWEGLERAFPHHASAVEALRAMEALPARVLPPGLRDELGRLRLDEARARAALADAERRAEQARTDLAALGDDPPILALAERVQSAAEHRPHLGLGDAAPVQAELAAARGRLREALAAAGLSDAAALVPLSPAQVERLRDAARRAMDAEAARVRLADADARVTAAERELARRAERRDALPLDPDTEAAAPSVHALLADEPRAQRAAARVRELDGTLARARAEREEAMRAFGGWAPAGGERVDLTSVDAVRAAASAWSVAATRRASEVAAASRLLAQRERELEEASRALVALPAAPPTPALEETLRSLEARAEGATRAFHRAVGADEAGGRAAERLSIALTDLGRWSAPFDAATAGARAVGSGAGGGRESDGLHEGGAGAWPEARLAAIRLDAAHEARLAGAASALREASAARERATHDAHTRREDRRALGAAPPEVPDLAPLRERATALAWAEVAVREREEARRGANGGPAWVRPVGLAIAASLLLAAVPVALAGLIPGAIVMLAGAVALGALAWRSGPRADADAPERAAREALTRAGLPPDAGPAVITRARAEVEQALAEGTVAAARAAQVAAAERQVADAERRLAGAVATESEARSAWERALAHATLPPVAPESLTELVAGVRGARELMAERDVQRRVAAEARREWDAWAREAAVSGTVPSDPTLGARLLEELRQGARASREAAATRRRQEQAVDMARSAQEAASQALRVADSDGGAARLESQARARATEAGVPPQVPLEGAADWLSRAAALRAMDGHLAGLAADREQAQAELAAWTERAEALAWLGAPDAATRRCEDAARLRETWRRADQEVAAAARSADDARAVREEVAAVDLVSGPAAWDAQRAACRLPALDPRQLESTLDAVSRAQGALDDVARLEGVAEATRLRVEAFVAEVTELAHALGRAAPLEADAARFSAALSRELAAAREEAARRDAARARVASEASSVEQAQRALHQSERELLALRDTAGAPSVDAIEGLLVDIERRRQLQEQADAARTAVREALGPWADDPETLELLSAGDRAAWAAAAEEARGELATAESDRDRAIEERTRLRHELEALERTDEIAAGEARRGEVLAQLADARRELADVVLAAALLERTLKRFREAHQPAVLRAAGQHLRTATGGTYVAVEATEDGRELVVVDAAGGRRTSAQLSRGTAELLYVVLRLGLAADRATHGALPLVLDDALVNLDPDRATGMARLLASVAERHQVLVLTCRPETRALLAAAGAAVVELPRFAGREHPVASPTSAATVSEAPSSHAAAILAVLPDEAPGLRRDDILERAGVHGDHWQRAIGQLKDQGLVVVHGKAKGTSYTRSQVAVP
ncbi:MAG: GntR family transcriptional regulator [Myxococcales bacterium]